jgi:hypothetical protein
MLQRQSSPNAHPVPLPCHGTRIFESLQVRRLQFQGEQHICVCRKVVCTVITEMAPMMLPKVRMPNSAPTMA